MAIGEQDNHAYNKFLIHNKLLLNNLCGPIEKSRSISLYTFTSTSFVSIALDCFQYQRSLYKRSLPPPIFHYSNSNCILGFLNVSYKIIELLDS